MAQYVHAGKTIDFTPYFFVPAGTVVVLGDLVCIANLDIPMNTPGALTVEGVFDFPKSAGAGLGIFMGTKVYWYAAGGIATSDDNSGANKYIGKVVADAGDDDITVRVKLDQ